MSLNTAHANNGVLIHAGEGILIFCDNVSIEFSGQDGAAFKGKKEGRVYLTTHRMIFNAKNASEQMQSFSFPFITLHEVQLEQPVFGANYIKGKVRAQENGNWTGEAKFKLVFKHGGAIDYGQAMLRAASIAQRNAGSAPPPPYTPPGGGWYAAPPPAYTPNPYNYGWVPPNTVFPDQPAPNSIYMHDSPPPYPGIIATPAPPNYPPQGGYPQQQGGFQQQPGGYPTQPGYPPPAKWIRWLSTPAAKRWAIVRIRRSSGIFRCPEWSHGLRPATASKFQGTRSGSKRLLRPEQPTNGVRSPTGLL